MHWLAWSLSICLCGFVWLYYVWRGEINTITAFHLNRDEKSGLNPASSDLSFLKPTNLIQPTTTSLHLTRKDLLGNTNPRSDQISCRDHGLSLIYIFSLSDPNDCESSTRPSDASIAILTSGELLVTSKRTEFPSFRFYLSKSYTATAGIPYPTRSTLPYSLASGAR